MEVKYKPRIGVDARPLSYGLTGNSRYLAEVLRLLIRTNSHFEYYLYTNKKFHPVFEDIYKNPMVRLPDVLEVNGPVWLNMVLPVLLQENRIDMFWGTLQLLPFANLKIPTFVNYHDLNFVSAPETMSRGNYIQHRLLSGRTLKNATSVFCLSANTKKDIADYLPAVIKKLKVIYPGVTRNKIEKEELGIKEPFFFTVGTLEPRKNLKTLIEGYLLLKTERPSFPYSLVIASRRGWGEKELTEKLVRGDFTSAGIIFLENPDDRVLQLLYKKCSAFLFPSKHEGFGLPLLEALVEQKVCVASDIPVFHEVLEPESDVFVPAMDVNAWKKAIEDMSQPNRTKRKKVWEEKRWSWVSTASQIEETFLLEWHKSLGTAKSGFSNAI